MDKYQMELLLINLRGMEALASKWMADTLEKQDVVNHLRFSFVLGDVRNAIKEVEVSLPQKA